MSGVINMRDTKQFDVRIDRKTKWGNPYRIGKGQYTREDSMLEYKKYILRREDLLRDLGELEGKVLGCWCKPKACHGDILIDLLENGIVRQLLSIDGIEDYLLHYNPQREKWDRRYISDLPWINAFCDQYEANLEYISFTQESGEWDMVYTFDDNLGYYTLKGIMNSVI